MSDREIEEAIFRPTSQPWKCPGCGEELYTAEIIKKHIKTCMKNIRFIMGLAKVRILTRYREGARIRNVEVQFLEPYKEWKIGDRIITPIRKCWYDRK